MILNPKLLKTLYFSHIDFGSGREEKFEMYLLENSPLTIEELHRKQLLGGKATTFKINGREEISRHAEIIADVNGYDAIGYNTDPCLYNADFYRQRSIHPSIPALEAIYLQTAFKKARDIELPIIEFSTTHGFIRIRQFSNQDIKEFWQTLILDYITKKYKKVSFI